MLGQREGEPGPEQASPLSPPEPPPLQQRSPGVLRGRSSTAQHSCEHRAGPTGDPSKAGEGERGRRGCILGLHAVLRLGGGAAAPAHMEPISCKPRERMMQRVPAGLGAPPPGVGEGRFSGCPVLPSPGRARGGSRDFDQGIHESNLLDSPGTGTDRVDGASPCPAPFPRPCGEG